MKQLLSLFLLFGTVTAVAQQPEISSRQLDEQEVEATYTDSLLSVFHIAFPIFRVYEYTDKGGTYHIVMTEKPQDTHLPHNANEGEVYYDSIKAYCLKQTDTKPKQIWWIRDFTIENQWSEEYSMSFWTKYFELDDYSGDGYVDPILVYGTLGTIGSHDGRIKILVYHHGKKYAIRHQNSPLDPQRNTKVDESYYTLPKGIQSRVREIMNQIMENDHGIFPYGWEKAMDNGQTFFDEN